MGALLLLIWRSCNQVHQKITNNYLYYFYVEILPYWKFATPDDAVKSAEKIYGMFEQYGRENDFVGMDMARKFLQMGFTRSRRYANHASGTKYDADKNVTTQEKDWKTSEKVESAKIFYEYYVKAKDDRYYQDLKQQHKGKLSKGK
ncbi:MAG: DUF4385 family protein [Chloroflexi bacterium]|nr:MAG: DUF4385 family protein [Chloroflexota bacterium]